MREVDTLLQGGESEDSSRLQLWAQAAQAHDLMRNFFKRQSIIPFETCFGFFCIYSGVAGIMSWGLTNDIFKHALGHPLSDGFNLAYIMAGLAFYFGIGLNQRNIEAFGLILAIASLTARSVVIFNVTRFSPEVVNSYVYTAGFSVACVVRLHSLAQHRTLVETQHIGISRSDD